MIFSALLQKKRATMPPKSYRADRFNQGFTALATKVTPLWGFRICKLYIFVWKYLYR